MLIALSVLLAVLKLAGLLAISWTLVLLPAGIAAAWWVFIVLLVVTAGIIKALTE